MALFDATGRTAIVSPLNNFFVALHSTAKGLGLRFRFGFRVRVRVRVRLRVGLRVRRVKGEGLRV